MACLFFHFESNSVTSDGNI